MFPGESTLKAGCHYSFVPLLLSLELWLLITVRHAGAWVYRGEAIQRHTSSGMQMWRVWCRAAREVVGHTSSGKGRGSASLVRGAREGLLLLETSFTPRLQKGAESPRWKWHLKYQEVKMSRAYIGSTGNLEELFWDFSCCYRDRKLANLNHYFTALRDRNPKIRCQQNHVLFEFWGILPYLFTHADLLAVLSVLSPAASAPHPELCLVITWHSPCVSIWVQIALLQGHLSHWMQAHSNDLILIWLYLQRLFPNHVHRYWSLALDVLFREGGGWGWRIKPIVVGVGECLQKRPKSINLNFFLWSGSYIFLSTT